jgi:hypothetical protein
VVAVRAGLRSGCLRYVGVAVEAAVDRIFGSPSKGKTVKTPPKVHPAVDTSTKESVVSPGSKASPVVSPSNVSTEDDGVFRPIHTLRSHWVAMAVGAVFAALAVIVMDVGVIPWRDTYNNNQFRDCTLPMLDCHQSNNTIVCWASDVTVAVSGSPSVIRSNVCVLEGATSDAAVRDGKSRNRADVILGVPGLLDCKAKTTLPSTTSYTPVGGKNITVRCVRKKDSGAVELDPLLDNHDKAVLVFCVIVFGVFAIFSLLLFIPIFYIVRERLRWYVFSSGARKRGPRCCGLGPLVVLLWLLLFVPLLAYFLVFWFVVTLVEVRLSLQCEWKVHR